jgi:hypothetical protein
VKPWLNLDLCRMYYALLGKANLGFWTFNLLPSNIGPPLLFPGANMALRYLQSIYDKFFFEVFGSNSHIILCCWTSLDPQLFGINPRRTLQGKSTVLRTSKAKQTQPHG